MPVLLLTLPQQPQQLTCSLIWHIFFKVVFFFFSLRFLVKPFPCFSHTKLCCTRCMSASCANDWWARLPVQPSPASNSRWLPFTEPSSASCFFLLKVSSSFPLSPSVARDLRILEKKISLWTQPFQHHRQCQPQKYNTVQTCIGILVTIDLQFCANDGKCAGHFLHLNTIFYNKIIVLF